MEAYILIFFKWHRKISQSITKYHKAAWCVKMQNQMTREPHMSTSCDKYPIGWENEDGNAGKRKEKVQDGSVQKTL